MYLLVLETDESRLQVNESFKGVLQGMYHHKNVLFPNHLISVSRGTLRKTLPEDLKAQASSDKNPSPSIATIIPFYMNCF